MARFLSLLAFWVLAAPAARPAPGPPLSSGLALANGLHALAIRGTAKFPDPFPIRRVLLADGVPLPVAPDGDPFQRLSIGEFERLVRNAARNGSASPKLLRAEYRATLAEDSLAGTGEWLFAADSEGPFALDPLKVAVRGAKWSDGREARLSGSPAKLWIDRPGRPAVTFGWSARGAEEPGSVRFHLGVPAAPLAVLELELPADRVPSAKAGALLAGPIARPGNRAAWRFAFGGESTLEFAVRLPSAGRPAPLANYARSTKIDLSPGLAAVTCDFEIVPLRDAPSSLEFSLDAGLVVSDVMAAGLANWRSEANRLVLTFREPFAGGKVAVAAVAALPADGQPWSVPNVHPANGATSVDLLELTVGSELKWDGCSPGDYRPVRSVPADRGLTITLRGSLPGEGRSKRLAPSLRLQGAGAEFTTVETLDWRVEPDRTVLTARIRATVSRGPLARLVIRVPAGASPGAVVGPDDPTAAITALGGDLWAIEPTLPVPAGETLDVRLKLRGPTPKFVGPDSRASIVLVGPSPVGATKRDGSTAVALAPSLRGWSVLPAGDAIGTGEWNYKYTRDTDIGLVLANRRIGEPERPEPPPVAKPGQWQFADLAATATVDPNGAPRIEFSGRIRAAAARALPVTLPAEAVLESVRVDGRWADFSIADRSVNVPVPEPDADGVAFLVVYRLPPGGSWFPRLHPYAPNLPGSPAIASAAVLGPDHRSFPSLSESATDREILIPAKWIRAVGYGFAALILGFAVARVIFGPDRTARPIEFLLVAALGTATWLAPTGWIVVIAPSLAVALFALVARNLRTVRAAAVAVTVLPVSVGVAQAPAAVTVYCLAESGDPARLAVLVPRSTLDRLAALSAPHLPAVILTDAAYSGTEVDGTARFDATWRIDVNRAGPHEYDLPLAGVKLDGMTLDGAAAFPDASKPGRYRIAVAGIGSHVLKAAFAVPTVTAGGDRESRFGIPDHPATRVSLALSPAGRTPEIVGRNGGRTTAIEGANATLNVDVGTGTSLAIRWRDTGTALPAATVLEATVWDINETRAEAVAGFLHRVEVGALARLAFDIPAGFDAGQFAVRETDSGAANGLKDWTLEPTPAGARLTLVLRQPARGLVATSFRLMPRDGPTPRPALAAPRCVTGDVTASYLGVRFAGVAAESWQIQNYLDVPADTVGREFAAVHEVEFDRSLARSLRREGPNPPLVRPTLRVTAAPAPAVQEHVWNLGDRADVVGTIQWTAAALPMAQCDLPAGIAIAEVDGTDLAGWERTGNRLRVWFRSDARDPTVKWMGTWSDYDPAKDLELPGVSGATVRVRPVAGAALAVPNAAAVKFLPASRPRERAYTVDPVAALPKFRVHLPGTPVLTQSESLVRFGNLFEHRAALDVPLRANRPYAFSLSLTNLPPGAEASVEWPVGAIGVEIGGPANRRTWVIDVAERNASSAKFVVITRWAARPAPELPDVELMSANVPLTRSDYSLVLPDDLRPAVGLARRTGNAWSVIADGPIRLVDGTKTETRAEPPVSATDGVAPLRSGSDGREWYAAPWLAGFLILGSVARWGGTKWWPELLFGFGILATAVAGWAFAGIAAAGLSLRLAQAFRAVGRRVIR